MTAEDYHKLLTYDPETGILTWKHRPDRSVQWNGKHAGKPAGGRVGPRNGKPFGLQVRVNGSFVLAHRIIWCMRNGSIPDGAMIDHENTNAIDNKWSNLRLANRSQNGCNRGKTKANSTGLKGVYMERRGLPWSSRIKANGKSIYIGKFRTKGEAAVAYAKAAIRYHGTFARF